MEDIKLSYVIATKNKLSFLKEVLSRLVDNVKPDEEIIVVDSASLDGTAEYLKDLYNQEKIHQFISEPDISEGHGYNKGLLLARGELIKFLSDDDVYYWPAITRCKEFMLANNDVDWLGSDCARIALYDPNEIGLSTSSPKKQSWRYNYEKWLKKMTPFEFCGLSIMIRKSSIPLLGLLNPASLRTDLEYTLRNTNGNANLAWYTGYMFVSIVNKYSRSLKESYRFNSEGRIFDIYKKIHYNHFKFTSFIWEMINFSFYDKVNQFRKWLSSLKRTLVKKVASEKKIKNFSRDISTAYIKVFKLCEIWLEEENLQIESKCLHRDILNKPSKNLNYVLNE